MRPMLLIVLSVVICLAGCSPDQRDQQVATASSIDTLPKLRQVTAFTGIDQDSAAFTSESLRGRVWLASFFFTSCGTVCPALNTVLAEIQRDVAGKVSFVSLTSDPDYDTPSVMKRYAQEYGAQEATWRFVTMPKDSMMRVASRDLGLIEPTAPDIHSTRFVLIDTSMQVRGYYDSADTAHVAKLRRILKAL